MMKTHSTPQTLQDAIKFFGDTERAHELMVQTRWPNGVACPRCGTMEPTYLAKYYRWQCKGCHKQFTVKVGTVFEDSPLKLEKCLTATWLITNAKNGISSCEIARSVGITQKSAWFLLHRVRVAMTTGSFEKFTGPVECDETFIGGKERNKHSSKKLNQGRGAVGKEIVMGLLERGGKVRAKHIPDTTANTLQSEVKAHVTKGAEVFTDAHRGYMGLSEDLEHAWVDHAVKYVEGRVHTNGCENFWSLFKRMLHGTYVHLDPRHLQSYVDEQATRFNMRKGTDATRFEAVAEAVVGKRLTYKALTERGLTTLPQD
jgi:transposase-like protein